MGVKKLKIRVIGCGLLGAKLTPLGILCHLSYLKEHHMRSAKKKLQPKKWSTNDFRPYECRYSFKIGQIFEVFKKKIQFWVKTYFELSLSLQMDISSIWYIIYHHWKSLLYGNIEKMPQIHEFFMSFQKISSENYACF